MNRRQLPLLLMLIAGAITTLTVYFKGLGLKTMLIALLAALVAFYFIGSMVEYILSSFDKKNAQEVSDEGEVIEKEAATPVQERVSEAAEEEEVAQ